MSDSHQPCSSTTVPTGEPTRLDRWLWAARFFKTRSQATAAVRGGRVHVNGARVRPARPTIPGDRVEITRKEWRREVVVCATSNRRGSAQAAAALYQETEHSIERNKYERDVRRSQYATAPPGRPDKRARRALRRLTGRAGDD